MKIRYLGTAAFEGIPAMLCDCRVCNEARKNGGHELRSRTQAVIDGRLLIDYPPDTYYHTVTGSLDMRGIKNIIITHSHPDHLAPTEMDMNFPPYAIRETYEAIGVYGNDTVIDCIENALGKTSLEKKHLAVHRIHPFEAFETDGYRIIPLEAVHKRDEQCLFYIVERDGKRIMYAHDTGKFTPADMEYIHGMRLDIVSLDCTVGLDRDGRNHMGFGDVLEMYELLAENGNVDGNTGRFVHHFSHNGRLTHREYLELCDKEGILPTFDGFEAEA